MSDEKSRYRYKSETDEGEVEAHRFVKEEPAEDETGKLQRRYRFKKKTGGSEDLGTEDQEARERY